MSDSKDFEKFALLLSNTITLLIENFRTLQKSVDELHLNEQQMITQLDSLEGRMMILNDKFNTNI